MPKQQHKAILLMGPTAAGKTDAAIHLHQHYQCDIISVDSALVYRGMNIGTAKPEAEVLAQAPHALVDICETWEPYSASLFCEDAKRLMAESIQQQRLPLLAGGTMLYYRALLNGLTDLPDANPEIRAQIEAKADHVGWQALHDELKQVDPESAARIHPNDPQRISRALEVYHSTGQSLTELFAQDQGRKLNYHCLKLVICPADRQVLHERIETRFHAMLAQGFLDEVEALMQEPKNHPDLPSMRSVGYRQAWEHLSGHSDLETMTFKGIVATRQLAKRQLTWLRKEPDTLWIDPTEKTYMNDLIQQVEAFIA
ncbi:tRNA (adenosine(37)-N6)-dimethylallyltransferase MiaA [Marinicella sp. W31]|uniref:tRNA (adenosine(37)-N6)-dimethylallyltransferase MiaA n=1 Tax=Marinicella sp. W31 TaxID=3023713 RepID=UPI003756717E